MNNWNGIASLFAACIELTLLINLLLFAEKNKINKIAMRIVTLLFGYQLLEFVMCGLNFRYSFLAYLAFVDISFLPPLTFLMVLYFLGFQKKYYNFIYLPAIAFTIYYALVINNFEVVQCSVLYASYNFPSGDLYGFFYYVPILISIVLSFIYLKKVDKNKISRVKILLAGLLFITVPVIAGFIFSFYGNNFLIDIIESMMCKFAFIFAVCLTIFSLKNKSINE